MRLPGLSPCYGQQPLRFSDDLPDVEPFSPEHKISRYWANNLDDVVRGVSNQDNERSDG